MIGKEKLVHLCVNNTFKDKRLPDIRTWSEWTTTLEVWLLSMSARCTEVNCALLELTSVSCKRKETNKRTEKNSWCKWNTGYSVHLRTINLSSLIQTNRTSWVMFLLVYLQMQHFQRNWISDLWISGCLFLAGRKELFLAIKLGTNHLTGRGGERDGMGNFTLTFLQQRKAIIYIYKLNLQTVLFRPLRSHQCSSEWFENWVMSTAQRAINTSHTDKQWHILFLNTRVCVYIYIYIMLRLLIRKISTLFISVEKTDQIFHSPLVQSHRVRPLTGKVQSARVDSRVLVDQSGRTEQLLYMSRAILDRTSFANSRVPLKKWPVGLAGPDKWHGKRRKRGISVSQLPSKPLQSSWHSSCKTTYVDLQLLFQCLWVECKNSLTSTTNFSLTLRALPRRIPGLEDNSSQCRQIYRRMYRKYVTRRA